MEKEKEMGDEGNGEKPVAFAAHRVQKGRIEKRKRSGGWTIDWAGYDKDKACSHCKTGHVSQECGKKLWQRQTAGRKGQSDWSFVGLAERSGPAEQKFI
jgi:hypothetical protein